MAAVTIAVPSGTTASSQFVLDGRGSKLAVFVASHAGNGWLIAFAPQSGGPFHRLSAGTGTGAAWSIFSGAGPAAGVVPRLTQWGRLETSSQTTAANSVTLLELSWTA